MTTRQDLAELTGAVAGTVLNIAPKADPEPSALQVELSQRKAADENLQRALLDIETQLCVLKNWLAVPELAIRSPDSSSDHHEGHRRAAMVGFDGAEKHLIEIRDALRELRTPSIRLEE